MKLFTRYIRINLFATIIIFILASLAFYFLLWYVSLKQVDEDLRIEQREIESYIAKYNRLPDPVNVKDQHISYSHSDVRTNTEKFSTVKIRERHRPEEFRQLIFTESVGSQSYLVTVAKSLEGVEHLNQSIIIISLVTIITILLVSLLINRWQLRKLWKPFYSTLAEVEKYRLGEKPAPRLKSHPIHEFNQMNQTINQFIQQAEKEYFHLKEFTENASHELQTPLAVLRSALDNLSQDEKLTENQSNSLQIAHAAIQNMSRLNQSLLLLSKIENRQFSDVRSFDFSTLVEQKMYDWQEMWQGRQLTIQSSLSPTPVSMNEELAEIMLNNLFSNAARHTTQGGSVNITLASNKFEISNTAISGPLDQEKLFKRFSKGGQSTDHYGLGLSIIKQIVGVSGKNVNYHFVDGRHVFSLQF